MEFWCGVAVTLLLESVGLILATEKMRSETVAFDTKCSLAEKGKQYDAGK